jgi:hypothetical protein
VLLVAVVLAVNLVRVVRRRRREPAAPVIDTSAALFDGLVRLRARGGRSNSGVLSLGMRIVVVPGLIVIRTPQWQHIRGVGREWRLPAPDTTMAREGAVLVLRNGEQTLRVRPLSRMPDLEEALLQAGVRHGS